MLKRYIPGVQRGVGVPCELQKDIAEPHCHNCIHEQDPYFILGSTIRTLTVGSLIFIVAFAWSELAKISFQKFGCHSHEIKEDRRDEFHAALRYAVMVTLLALLISFFVMFYIRGTKW